MDFVRVLKRIEKLTIDNSPAILTALGVTGTLTTAYLTGKASIKATLLLQEIHEEQPNVALEPKDVVKQTWRLYIPPATSAALTIAAIVCANRVSTRRATAMAAAYSISEKAFSEYKDKVVERIGDKKEQAIRDDVAQDRMSRDPVDNKTVIITAHGDVLCYDKFTGRYFKSSMEALRQAENEMNHIILHQGYASLSDFYHEVGLPSTSISEELGWNTDQLLHLQFSTVMSDDGRPCIALDFDLHPTRNFDKFGGH